jgi:DNA-binding CsgD family transcriptional regulator
MKRVSTTITLSKREENIARLIAWGYVQKEIADMLEISIQTVSVHLRNIYSKLKIHKETDLTRYWIFREYSIADNFMKTTIAVFFLLLSVSSVLFDVNMVRAQRCRTLCAKTLRSTRTRTRRSKTIEYNLLTA